MAQPKITIKEALAAAMSPYALPNKTVDLLLIEQGLDGSADYDVNKAKEVYTAVIEGLIKFKSLTKEKDPGSENDYDVSKIDDMIRHYRAKYGIEDIDAQEQEFIDRTDEY